MNPTYGQKLSDKKYQTRLGVYAVVTKNNDQEICLVQAPNGAFFLPGGEIEEGEDHKEALLRELHEELGAKADLGDFLGQADEYFYSSHRDTYYYNPAYIYDISNFEIISAPLEDFNNIFWFPVDEAIKRLKRGSHKWGIEEWLRRKEK
ncbi:NUDIX hydrolase [Floricoccus penangensis]|uniref:NUDIX hydrolase n=1 Tax=Floricoccus penangensis TaxID=1859475 RepID=A0A9Q5JHH8_9LACT|nr:NUDIX hydrolase [Floricoccus penangensis]OFI47620.1 NUDIX hydrolase [Floricoccus penangensis]URZ87881.1 NUDIX hydrolase [Floricoccus penangensis]